MNDAVAAVEALARSRLRARGADGDALRDRLAGGGRAAGEFVRGVVREWVTDRLAAAESGAPRLRDDVYERLVGLAPRITPATTPSGWEIRLTPSRSAPRSVAGVFYTPMPLVEWVLDAALEPAIADARARAPRDRDGVLALRVLDPACGSGRFLVGAARRLAGALARDRAAPGDPTPDQRAAALRDAVGTCVHGVDIDDVAVMLCRSALVGLVDEPLRAGVRDRLDAHVRTGDALLGAARGVLAPERAAREDADAWCASFFPGDARAGAPARGFFHWFLEFPDVPGFDVVLGNPPFLNQLESTTAVDAGARALLRARFDGAVRGYADMAAAFLLLATELAGFGGRVGLVLPRSLLAVAHAGPARARVLERGVPTAVWVGTSGAGGFAGTNVATCAVVVHKRDAGRGELARAAGPSFVPLAPLELDAQDLAARPSWSHLFADADGVPPVTVRATRTIADLADATADFRDQYYGLQGFIVDSPEPGGPERRRPKLVTSGLIGPLESLWGRARTRVHKRVWLHPRVDLDALERAARTDPAAAKLAAWARARLVPKVLLATQTRVLEALPDPEGVLLPCVPVITVTPKDPARLWHVAAALASPAATLVAFTRHAGAGMSADAIKLSAKQVLALPAPEDGPRFDAGAEAAGRVCAGGAGLGAESVPECLDLDEAARAAVRAWWVGRCGRSTG